jgi:tRNA pseudouridine38-40 synthase
LSYKGTNYHGWQVQPNAITVQEVLERDLSLVIGEEIKVTGCGRTDTGVHAKVFYAHFDSGLGGLEKDADLIYHINGKLPVDITVHDILSVQPDAHARFSAVSRTYKYYILLRKDPFRREVAHTVFGKLNTGAMQKAADLLKEYTDFTSFSKIDTDVKTNDCRITKASWDISPERLVFKVTADRFLRNMVRAIVGTLLDVGFGKTDLQGLREIIESKNRSNAGASAPAKGLFLTDVIYRADIYKPD